MKPGDRIADRYRLLREAGRGAHGVVFEAHDEGLNRTVAVKQLINASPRTLERFQREGKAIASLSHPGIVQVYDMLLEHRPPCLVLEWVPGDSLAERLEREGTLSADAVNPLMFSLAEALDHAHRSGVLHRDIKPDNILLGSDGPKLTDFGLAKVAALPDDLKDSKLELSADLRTSLTAAGGLVGTPSYMAPEQARADMARIGPATDVFGLGATIYEALTGAPPFERDTLVELLVALSEEDPPTPSEALGRRVEPELEALLLRCLARDPEDRPESTELMVELRNVSRSGRQASVSAPLSQRTALAGGAVLGVVMTLLVIAIGVVLSRKDTQEPKLGASPAQVDPTPDAQTPKPRPTAERSASPAGRPTASPSPAQTPAVVRTARPRPTLSPTQTPKKPEPKKPKKAKKPKRKKPKRKKPRRKKPKRKKPKRKKPRRKRPRLSRSWPKRTKPKRAAPKRHGYPSPCRTRR